MQPAPSSRSREVCRNDEERSTAFQRALVTGSSCCARCRVGGMRRSTARHHATRSRASDATRARRTSQSPESAVSSYLDWTSYAYLIGNSDVASHTMSPEEEVRVNSYVQLNAEQQRRISQVLVSFKPRKPSVEGTRATLGADEVWDYRYISANGRTGNLRDLHRQLRDDLPRVLLKPEHVGGRLCGRQRAG